MSQEVTAEAGPVSSIPAGPAVVSAVSRFLGFIDDLPQGATGALHFGRHGVVLLEARKICWAVSPFMRFRLTDILRQQSTRPLARETVETIYRACRETGRPVGEALVESGLVTEAGLRIALLRHTGEALVQLAQSGAAPDEFTPHTRRGYDPRYSFSACEMLAMFGGLEDPARAAAAHTELLHTLVPDSAGAAFARGTDSSRAVVIAVDRGCDLLVRDLNELCSWISGLFDVARLFDEETCAMRAAWGVSAGLVAWRTKEVGYVGVCASRAAAARLLSHVRERASRVSGVLPVASFARGWVREA